MKILLSIQKPHIMNSEIIPQYMIGYNDDHKVSLKSYFSKMNKLTSNMETFQKKYNNFRKIVDSDSFKKLEEVSYDKRREYTKKKYTADNNDDHEYYEMIRRQMSDINSGAKNLLRMIKRTQNDISTIFDDISHDIKYLEEFNKLYDQAKRRLKKTNVHLYE